MKDQLTELVQGAASGKMAGVVAVGAVSSPSWVSFINSPTFEAIVMICGILVSMSIVAVNFATWRLRRAERKNIKRRKTDIKEEATQ